SSRGSTTSRAQGPESTADSRSLPGAAGPVPTGHAHSPFRPAAAGAIFSPMKRRGCTALGSAAAVFALAFAVRAQTPPPQTPEPAAPPAAPEAPEPEPAPPAPQPEPAPAAPAPAPAPPAPAGDRPPPHYYVEPPGAAA